jgi:SAM-dependent methyltransferase
VTAETIEISGPAESAALAAYQATAPFYDEFTADHDYELWLGNLLPQLRHHGLAGQRLLDVGCGTGKSFLPLLEEGWQVTAVDISPAMLAVAAEKAGGRARLEVADMRDLPELGRFDLVWCLDDAINYLLSASELESALTGFARQLAPGGLCLFDSNTLSAYRGFWSEEHRVATPSHELHWEGLVSPKAPAGTEMRARLSALTSDGQLVAEALHRERHFRQEEIEAALALAGFECLQIFGHGYDAVLEQPLDEQRHSKSVYIARVMEGR